MKDEPICVEIPAGWRATIPHFDPGSGEPYVRIADLISWVRRLRRAPEPEQRACVECRDYRRNDGLSSCSRAARVPRQPWLRLWQPGEQACPAWQPRRDKAEELAETIAGEVGDVQHGAWCKSDVKKTIARVLREAGIGGESDA